MERRKHGSLGPHTLVNLELQNLLFRVLQVQRTWIEGVQLLIKGLFFTLTAIHSIHGASQRLRACTVQEWEANIQ